jgi:DNA-binding response OmpR family regulator
MEKILVQDSDAMLLDTLKVALEMENFNVHTVLEYEEDFLDLIHKFRPHVVLLDYKFDGRICREICDKIKEKYPHLPVIAMSCNINIHEDYSKSCFDDYISKPFDLDLLYRILRKHIHNPNTKTTIS